MPRSTDPPPALWATWLARWFLAFALLVCAPSLLHAQQYSIRYHTQTQGLDNLVVTALAQDVEGYLWIGTENGLYRYDGAAFGRISLMNDPGIRRIYAVHIDKTGNVWVGTSQGLYVLADGVTTPVRYQGAIVPVEMGQTLASDSSGRVLVASKGSLLVVQRAPGGAWKAHPFLSPAQPQQHHQVGTGVTSVHVDGNDVVWFGCGTALCRAAGEVVDLLQPPKEIGPQSWSAIFKDSRGDLWLRSLSRLLQLPANASAFVDRTPPRLHEGLPLLSTPIAEDASGRILTVGDGNLRRWDGQQWSTIDAGNGLSAGAGIGAVLADRDGGLWIGTSGLGLAQWLGYSHFATWTAKDGLADDEVWAFGRDRLGHFHVGTAAGVSRKRAGHQRFTPEIGRPLVNATGSVAEDGDGYLWYGDSSGSLVRTHQRTQESRKVATLPAILKIFVDSAGRIWVGTKQGIFLIEQPRAGEFRARRVDEGVNPDPAQGPRSLDACETASGLLWFATDRGLLVWAQGRLQRARLHRTDGASSVPADFGALACTGDADAWAGGPESQGIWRVHWTGQVAEITDVTPPHLRDRSVMGVLEDRRGWLWVSTDYGVSVWNQLQWRSFSQDSGLAWNDCNQGALYEDLDGSIWIGTVRGATHVEHVESIFGTPGPRVAIASLTRGPQRLDMGTPLTLSWDREPLDVEFASPVYEDRRLIRFQYRLVGLRDAWSIAAGSEVTFAPLLPGEYTLQVRSQNITSRAESAIASFDFRVTPPWWRTLPFYAFCAGVLVLAAWGLHAWRLAGVARRQRELEHIVVERTAEVETSREQLRKLAGHNARALEEERMHVSRELHDEMGQQLAALRMEVSVLGVRARSDQRPGPAQLDILLQRVDRLVTSVRSLVSQLRPPALDGGLAAALEWLAAEFTRGTGVPCRLDLDASAGDLVPDQATMVFRIAQESLTNVRRHAQAAQVVLSLRRGDGGVVLSVADDGAGFDTASPRTGHGLLGMQERARLLGGELTIASAALAGTTIRLRIDPALPQPG